ncbi:hypothetical protein F5050DRAFT_1111860 [Lentinula boryana]|uniref:Uncharacterized protein n=1 Tax=Lentinula boryana TaxID=40481 RepID=A0ABQ8PYZ8_9AGAR|nr:hypothetical protein F5050DRAFT_1111860 [Lentinula boryana]
MNDNDHDYANDDDFQIPTQSKSYQVEYTSIMQSLGEKSMKEEVDHVSGIFGVEPSTAALLLSLTEGSRRRVRRTRCSWICGFESETQVLSIFGVYKYGFVSVCGE